MYRDTPDTRSFYICVTDKYWGTECSNWGAVGWNTGTGWGYKPKTALEKTDHNGKSLISRMTLVKSGTCNSGGTTGNSMSLTLTIENPQRGDEGMYVLGAWMKGGTRGDYGKFYLKDMSEGYIPPSITQRANPLMPRMQTLGHMMAIADPTYEDTLAMETGYNDLNAWLEWVRYTVHRQNKSNCYVCASARPHLGTVPLDIPEGEESCFLSLFTNTTTSHSGCETWKATHPIVSTNPKPGEGATIYPGQYLCYQPTKGNRFMGNFTEGFCSSFSTVPDSQVQNQVQSLADVYWICGDGKLRSRLKGEWTGQCALAKLIMPFHILPDTEGQREILQAHRSKREAPAGSLDPLIYVDAIGVPRGVPNAFKGRDQVKQGFLSVIAPLAVINENVDWINYLFYNQQRFINHTRDALQGLADQLGPTSTMAFQNRMALDMMLAEKGGVCKMIGESCCTYIPNDTGPTGKVTVALTKLDALSKEWKKNSGIEDPWDSYFGWLKGWQRWLAQIGVIIGVVLLILLITCICVIPCVKGLVKKGVAEMTPAFPMIMATQDEKETKIPLMKTTTYYDVDNQS